MEVITKLKPKDERMQAYLREFLFWVCKYNFEPIASKINTRENDIADFLSHNFSEVDARKFFLKLNLTVPSKIEISNDDYDFIASW